MEERGGSWPDQVQDAWRESLLIQLHPSVCRKDTVETYLTNGRCRSVEPCCSLQCQRIPGLLPRSQGLLVRLVPIGQDRAQHGSARLLAHLVVLVRIVLGHVHGAHPTVQRRLLLLKLLEGLSGLSNCNVNADDVCHCEPCHRGGQGGWRWRGGSCWLWRARPCSLVVEAAIASVCR